MALWPFDMTVSSLKSCIPLSTEPSAVLTLTRKPSVGLLLFTS